MRKKAILILLLVPFLIAIIAFASASSKIREVEQDITNISFNYKANEAFILKDKRVKLEAEAIYDKSLPLASSNNLVWLSSDSTIAEVRLLGSDYYLYFLNVGEVTITCQNEKGTVSKSFKATIVGDDGAIILNFDKSTSGQSITGDFIVGLYNLDYINFNELNLINDVETFNIDFVNTNPTNLTFDCSNNLEVDLNNKEIRILASGESYLKIYDENNLNTLTSNLEFEVIDGVNVYSYNDLLMATNFCEDAKDIALRVNLESLNNTYDNNMNLKSADTVLFGNYSNGSFNFNNEVYRFTTTFNHDFIDKWNEVAEPISTTITAGIHLRSNLYGNGFTINMHNLCYPSDKQEISSGNTTIEVPLLSSNDLFRGPLIYLSIGAPKTNSTLGLTNYTYAIYALYGQDNIGLYVDGDNLSVSDVHLKNCDYGNNFYNLEYSGTVLELNGNNISVKDSIIENGRNVIRSFSSNVNIDNCLLQNGMEFLVKTGSNKGVRVNLEKRIYYGNSNSLLNKDYLSPSSNVMNKDYKADSILTNAALYNTPGGAFFGFSEPIYTKEEIISNNEIIKDALSNEEELYDFNGNKKYDNYLTITNTLFANSGLSAIMLDTLSNGSYLESNITSLFSLLLGQYIPLFPNKMAYTSYPTNLNLSGDNRFYDWKSIDNLDYSSLLFQDIAGLILAHGGVGSVEVTDDNYLPLRLLIKKEDTYHLQDGNITHVNLPIMKMGGGPNLSDVNIDDNLLEEFSVDPYIYSLDLKTEMVDDFMTNNEAKRETMLIAMTRASSNVLGFEPYNFYALKPEEHYWYKETPNVSTLRDRYV